MISLIFLVALAFFIRFLIRKFKKRFPLFSKSTILITGGEGSLGSLLALKFARNYKCKIIIMDIYPEAQSKMKAKIENEGGKSRYYQCDLSNTTQTEAIFKKILKENTIDMLINNAGIHNNGKSVEETEISEVEKLMS